MNKTGIIKMAILVLAFIINIINPVKVPAHQNFIFPVVVIPAAVIIFFSFAVPFIIEINSNFIKFDLSKPTFNDNPLTFKRVLSPTQFLAQLCIVGGIGINIRMLMKYHLLNSFGIETVAYGIALLIGIRLTLLWIKPKLPRPR